MLIRSLLAVGLSLVPVLSGHAQLQLDSRSQHEPHPDLSGTWRLNPDKSDYGDLQGPETRIDVIEQHDGQIRESVTAEGRHRKQRYTLLFTTDGTPATLPEGTRMGTVLLRKVSAVWQDTTLIVTQKLEFQGAPLVTISRYTLSADATTLTMALGFAGDPETAATFVFDRVVPEGTTASE
jgi:hypothetical protein